MRHDAAAKPKSPRRVHAAHFTSEYAGDVAAKAKTWPCAGRKQAASCTGAPCQRIQFVHRAVFARDVGSSRLDCCEQIYAELQIGRDLHTWQHIPCVLLRTPIAALAATSSRGNGETTALPAEQSSALLSQSRSYRIPHYFSPSLRSLAPASSHLSMPWRRACCVTRPPRGLRLGLADSCASALALSTSPLPYPQTTAFRTTARAQLHSRGRRDVLSGLCYGAAAQG